MRHAHTHQGLTVRMLENISQEVIFDLQGVRKKADATSSLPHLQHTLVESPLQTYCSLDGLKKKLGVLNSHRCSHQIPQCLLDHVDFFGINLHY